MVKIKGKFLEKEGHNVNDFSKLTLREPSSFYLAYYGIMGSFFPETVIQDLDQSRMLCFSWDFRSIVHFNRGSDSELRGYHKCKTHSETNKLS